MEKINFIIINTLKQSIPTIQESLIERCYVVIANIDIINILKK